MPTSSQKAPQAIASLLSKITCDQGWQQQLDSHRLFLHWDRLVDTDTSAHARPLKIVGDVLWLEVTNSAWMQQLQFQKIQLLEMLSEPLRLSRLTDIRFTLADNSGTKGPDKPKVSFTQPDTAEREAFHEQVATVENETIRNALMSLWYQSHSCRRK